MTRARAAMVALAALALAGCGRSEATPADASGRPWSPAGSARGVSETAEGPRRQIGTLGDACERGVPEAIDPPDEAWSVTVLDTIVSDRGDSLEALERGIEVRHPRDWMAEQTTSFVVSRRDGRELAEVHVRHLRHLGPAGSGGALWDERIQALEELNGLRAERASPLSGGRCLVRGRALLGPFAAVLSPLGPTRTVAAVTEFPDAFDVERTLDAVPPASLATAMRIMNSVQAVEVLPETTT